MHIDGIIHHTFIQTTDRTDQSLTAGEMSRIGLCREITWIVLATQADREFIQRDIFTHLGQQPHSFSIMNLYIFECRIRIMIHKYTRSRTTVSTEHNDRSRYQFLVLPRRKNLAGSNLCDMLAAHTNIAGGIDQSLCISFKSDAPGRDMFPTFPFSDKVAIAYFVLHPGSDLVGDQASDRVVLQHFHLADMWIRKIDTKVLQCTVLRTDQRNRKHPPMENKFGTLSVKYHILHIFKSQSHQFRIILVMVGNEVFTFGSTFGIEIITSLRQQYPDRIGVHFRRNLLKSFRNQRRSILPGIRFQTISGQVIRAAFTCRKQSDK